MVLYFFPPLGGVSMSRNVRNVQYLPDHGWAPVVLTPWDAGYHLKDPVSLALVPDRCRVIRTSSIEAGHVRSGLHGAASRLVGLRRRFVGGLGGPARRSPERMDEPAQGPAAWSSALSFLRRAIFFPDDQVGWLPFAVIAALRAHRETPFDAIYSTSSPVTSHLVAAVVRWRTGLPWVAEFRDPWLGNALANPLPWLHRRLQVKLERWIVGSADRIIGLSPGITQLYRTRYPDAPPMVTVTSGYDRGEARVRSPHPRGDGRFRVVYTGTLDRPTELEVFLDGLDRALARQPGLRGRLEVSFYGIVSDSCREVVDRFAPRGLTEMLRFHGFIPRPDALAALASADAALILLGAGPGMGLFIGGKLFDYIGQDLQILAMLPRGDSRAILESLGWGVVCDPEPEAVADAVVRLVSLPPPVGRADPEGRYDRAVLAGQLARSLDDVVAAAQSPAIDARAPGG